MTRRYFFSLARLFDHLRGCASCNRAAPRVLLAVASVAVAGLLSCAQSAVAGTVSGSIGIERTALRTEGPKHDLDVVVYLEPVNGAEQPPADAHASMDQTGLVFVPHVLAVQKGTTVTFLNNDNDQHNVYFLDDKTGESLDIGTWGPGVSVDYTFTKPGMMITLCKLHLEMAAYVVVLDNPWFKAVALDPATSAGTFTVDNVPPGEYLLDAWHKKLKLKGGAKKITVTAGSPAQVEIIMTKAKYARSSG